MKKNILMSLACASLMLLSSCSGGGTAAVVGKSFTYKECVSATMTTGTEEQLYDDNPIATNKDGMLERIKKAMYYNGEEDGTALTFSDHMFLSSTNYNGYTGASYEVNYTKVGDYGSASNCSYYVNNGNIILISYDLSAGEVIDQKYELYSGSGSSSFGSYSKKVIMDDKSITYDEANKLLTTVFTVTYTNTVDNSTTTSVCEFTITWEQAN